MRRVLLLTAVFAASLSCACAPAWAGSASGRAPGIDLTIESIGFDYVNNQDHLTYGLVSPISIASLGKSAELHAVHGMTGIPQRLSIVVGNTGDTMASGAVVEVTVKHDEYEDFILFQTSTAVPDIQGGTNTTISVDWTPDYSGTHRLETTVTHIQDTNSANDNMLGAYIIGTFHTSFPNAASWTFTGGSGWAHLTTDGLIGTGPLGTYGTASCLAIGRGAAASGVYAPNLNASATSSVFGYGDAHPTPTRQGGASVIFGGTAPPPDGFHIEYMSMNGGWKRATTDIQTNEGGETSWRITSSFISGANVNRIGMPAEAFHSQSQFRFTFLSDASTEDMGLYFDEFTVMYDQKARAEEFGLNLALISDGTVEQGGWGGPTFELRNTGNLTETFVPSWPTLPAGWSADLLKLPAKTRIHNSTGVKLAPNQTVEVMLQLHPDKSASLGAIGIDLGFYSSEQNSVQKTVTGNPVVEARSEVVWDNADLDVYCAAGGLCTKSVKISNLGPRPENVNIELIPLNLRTDWTAQLSEGDPAQITIPSGSIGSVELVFNLPISAQPGERTLVRLDLEIDGRGDPAQHAWVNATVAPKADAETGIDSIHKHISGDWSVQPGKTRDVVLSLWNNGTGTETFTITPQISNDLGWGVEVTGNGTHAVSSTSGAHRVRFAVTAPSDGLMGDLGPRISLDGVSAGGAVAVQTGSITVTVGRVLEIHLDAPYPPSEVLPGKSSVVTIKTENHGNAAEEYALDIEVPEGWSHTDLVPMEGTNLHLDAPIGGISSQGSQFTITAPSNADAGPSGNIRVTLESPHENMASLLHQTNLTIPLTVSKTFGLEWSSVPQIGVSAEVGEMTEIPLHLSNTGNSRDTSSRIRLELKEGEAGAVSLIVAGKAFATEEWAEISAKAGRDFEIYIRVSPNETDLNSKIKVKVQIETTTVPDLNPKTLSHDLEIQITARRDFSSWIYPPALWSVAPEDTLTWYVGAANDGTVYESIQVVAELENEDLGWDIRYDPGGKISIQPGQNITSAMLIRLTAPELAFGTNLTIRVIGSDGTTILLEESYPISVRGSTSVGELANREAEAGLLAEGFQPIHALIFIPIFLLLAIVGYRVIRNKGKDIEHYEEDANHTHSGQNASAQQASENANPTQYHAPHAYATTQHVQPVASVQDTNPYSTAQVTNPPATTWHAAAPSHAASNPYATAVLPNASTHVTAVTSVHTEQSTAVQPHTPDPMNPTTQVQAPQQHANTPPAALNSAFAALGGPSTGTQVMGATMPAGPPQSVAPPSAITQQATSPVTTPVPAESAAHPEVALPNIPCLTCGNQMTSDVAWTPCVNCGSFHHSTCYSSVPTCAGCGASTSGS